MLIKVDEDLPRASVLRLRAYGHDSMSVIDEGLGGASDEALWQAVQEEGRFLITADKGFADARKYEPGMHTGILLLRPDQDGVLPTLELLDNVLATHRLEDLAGAITVATPRGIRIRH